MTDESTSSDERRKRLHTAVSSNGLAELPPSTHITSSWFWLTALTDIMLTISKTIRSALSISVMVFGLNPPIKASIGGTYVRTDRSIPSAYGASCETPMLVKSV